MRLRKTIPATALFVVGASMALAQNMPAKPYYSDDAVQKMIHHIQIYNGKPTLAIAEARRAMDAAWDSAAAKWCGIANSERIFRGFIGHAQHVLKYDDRKLTSLSLIHGVTQARTERSFASGGPCPPELKKQLEAKAAQMFNRRP